MAVEQEFKQRAYGVRGAMGLLVSLHVSRNAHAASQHTLPWQTQVTVLRSIGERVDT